MAWYVSVSYYCAVGMTPLVGSGMLALSSLGAMVGNPELCGLWRDCADPHPLLLPSLKVVDTPCKKVIVRSFIIERCANWSLRHPGVWDHRMLYHNRAISYLHIENQYIEYEEPGFLLELWVCVGSRDTKLDVAAVV
ncbi:hypothetical protein BO79DRAFT_221182 [Aspergillus costaricaensis CBS 115574]|uniref:Uncharacterized protein n=1 Tax=Aspergillus costaricaensis CBS 115574 TaxID=1448317 RepID=A0ACD1I5I1_9EURO|nr:hypothetical protein BO79DRAFT_221182 [Aspergillus costaricaensis CBS 115574]RAK85011.1 hypothetical protein BO79DRAFT_221182 [Aspergillus costaricaensis CBS 115574]